MNDRNKSLCVYTLNDKLYEDEIKEITSAKENFMYKIRVDWPSQVEWMQEKLKAGWANAESDLQMQINACARGPITKKNCIRNYKLWQLAAKKRNRKDTNH